MLKLLTMVVAAAFLAFFTMQSEVLAGKRGHGYRMSAGPMVDITEELDLDDAEDDGPDCEWIAKQVRRVGSAYWKTRYHEECVSTVDAD